MALIKCEECGHSVSDRATSCPHCGCPIQGDAFDFSTDAITSDIQPVETKDFTLDEIIAEVKSADFKTTGAHTKNKETKKSDSPQSNSGCLGVFIVIAALMFLLSMCGDSGSSSSSGSKGTCGICGGSGVVTSKILGEGAGVQRGFDMYYRCKGCHGSGRD